MNNLQQATIERLTTKYTLSDAKYEIKELTISETEFHAEFRIITGLIGDEGTMAECYGRTTHQLFVGKRGGVSGLAFQKKEDGSNNYKAPMKKYTGWMAEIYC